MWNLCTDLHVGIPKWREEWHTWRYHSSQRHGRRKGVWDARMERQIVTLHDGRRLTYFIDGNNDAARQRELPHVFVFHAMFLSGNSFLSAEPPSDYVLVCVNRPGYFGSDAVDGTYSYDTFADDIRQLADHLGVSTFSVAGHSSGGPCALACAAFLPQRVVAVGLLASDPEYAHPNIPSKRRVNALCLGYILPWLLKYMLCWLPVARHAVRGMETDYRLETLPYPFETESIRQATLVYLGANDRVMPLAVTRHVHERLSNVRHVRIVPHVGHLSLLRDAILTEFFEELVHTAVEEENGTVHPKGDVADAIAVETKDNIV